MRGVKRQRIPYSVERPRVIIIGAGIAGLTVAHELQRSGKFEIEVIEKRSAPGGKARTEWTEDGFREHSMRILPGSYVCMHQTLGEIETEQGTAIDRLRPATILFRHGAKSHEIRGDYSSFLGPLRYARDALGLIWFLKRAGVSLRELIVFLYKIVYLLFTPESKVITELSRLKFSEYVSRERPSPGFENVIFRVAEILVAAKSYASAAVVTRTLLEWFVTPFLRGKYVRPSISEFDSPTNDALIDPWVSWLQQQNVRFRFNTTTKGVSARAGKLEGIHVETCDVGETIQADAYVLAVQHNIADALLDDSLKRYIPDLVDFPRLGEEWAHSVQFHISKLEGKLAELGSRSVAMVDSPWSIGLKVYSKASWREDSWERSGLGDDEAILTATISNSNRPGIVHGLPLLRCTEQQILEEVLTQSGLTSDLSTGVGSLGLDIAIEDAADINEEDYPGFAISAVGNSEQDLVFLSDSLMYIRLPGNLDIEPDNATGIFNLFLAGEYTRTNYRIPTMEKSCESGKRPRQSILEGFGFETDETRVPTCRLPFALLRSDVVRFLLKLAVWLFVLGAIIWLATRPH